MAIFEGAGVALVTPFTEEVLINYDKFEELVEEQIAGGTDSIIVCGTTGEASTLTHEEHIRAIQFVIDVTKKRIPVIAGTGSNCTATAQYLSKCAEEAGADGLLLVSPYYNKATQKGLIRHFTAIAETVNIPALLYNVPDVYKRQSLRCRCTSRCRTWRSGPGLWDSVLCTSPCSSLQSCWRHPESPDCSRK